MHRGNRIPRPRDKPPKIAFRPETVSAETETQPQEPANCGLLGRLQEFCSSKDCEPDRYERTSGAQNSFALTLQSPIRQRTAAISSFLEVEGQTSGKGSATIAKFGLLEKSWRCRPG